MFQSKIKYVSLLVCLSLLSCQDILECVVNKHPELPNKNFAVGYVDNFYFDSIKAEIKNEPGDNSYFYYFSVSGDLPQGIEVYEDHRRLILEGFPVESGTFNFRIDLIVEQTDDYEADCENEWNDCDGLCTDEVSEHYRLVIN